MLKLPTQLDRPVVISGEVGSKVMLDLSVYLVGPSETELEFLLDLYDRVCPKNFQVRYTIAELGFWPPIAQPVLTASGRAAAKAGVSRPYFEPVRKRIRDGRAFEAAFWDGRPIEDPDGSWSFGCRRIHLRSTGLHAFVRVLAPIDTDYHILRAAALEIADNVELHSGHGGLAFGYDTWLKEAAFDRIYAQARRFWGVDVEDLNGTLPLMKSHIKGVNWLTLVGASFASDPEIEQSMGALASAPDVAVERKRFGAVIVAGPNPVVGDQNQVDGSLDPYYAVAHALQPLFLRSHPDFPGAGFISNVNTVGWIRRFVDPDGWR